MQTGFRLFQGAALALLVVVTGCGGGAHTGSPMPAASGGDAVTQSARLTITIDAPQATTSSAHRSAKYISAATQSLTANITPQGSTTSIAGYPQTVNLTATTNGCSSTLATTQCSLTLSVPADSYNVTITTFDGANGTGNLLSAAQSVPVTIQPGVVNTLGISLGGIPTSARIVSDAAAITGDPTNGFVLATSGSAPVSVFGVDADGNYILGVGAPAVALASSDSTQFTVSTPNASAPNQFTIANVTSAAAAVATLTATVTPSAQSGASPLTQAVKFYSQSQLQLTAPMLTGISGNMAVPGQVVNVTLTGTNFNAPNSTVNVSGSGVTATTVSATSTTIVAQLTVSSSATPGTVLQLTVTTPGGTSLAAQAFTVLPPTSIDRFDDTAPGSPPGTGTGTLGDLRYAMLHAAAGATLTFAGCNSCTVSLNGPLPPITRNLNIDGTGATGEAYLDEGSAYRLFFVDTGTVALSNMHVQNVAALGGAGGYGITFNNGSASNNYSGNGGGGAGLGAALFVNQAGAMVTVTNVTFTNCKAQGGNAPFNTLSAVSSTYAGGGGGGGLSGSGSNAGANSNLFNGGAGGGVLASASGVNGGYGDGAAGYQGTPGAEFSGDPSANGTAGGFGGGGAAGQGQSPVTVAGAGGFGGGGGGAGTVLGSSPGGGAGGPGGGGGGGSFLNEGSGHTYTGAGGAGGSLGTVSGGFGGAAGGGGGAAAGPAIFVNAGTLVISGGSAANMSASGGRQGIESGETTQTETAGTADATPVYNYAGSVNGSTAQGPVAGAL